MSHNNQGSYPRQSQSFKGKWGSLIKSSTNNLKQSIKRGVLNAAGRVGGKIGAKANMIPRMPKTVVPNKMPMRSMMRAK